MITKRNDLLSKKVIQSLKNRHMNGYYVHSKQEAVDLAFEIMKPGSSVGWGGSDTLNKIGIKEELYKRNFINEVDNIGEFLTGKADDNTEA